MPRIEDSSFVGEKLEDFFKKRERMKAKKRLKNIIMSYYTRNNFVYFMLRKFRGRYES